MAAAARLLALAAPTASVASPSRVLRPSQASTFGSNVKLAGPQQLRRLAPVAATTTAVDLDKLVADIKGLTLEQARTLTDRLQEELGVSASAMMPMGGAVAAPGGAATEAAPVVEEKTEFDLFLDEVPANARISVIKVIRTLTSLGLKEAKDLIEGLPKKIKEAVAKEDAEEAQKALEAVGAKCSIK